MNSKKKCYSGRKTNHGRTSSGTNPQNSDIDVTTVGVDMNHEILPHEDDMRTAQFKCTVVGVLNATKLIVAKY